MERFPRNLVTVAPTAILAASFAALAWREEGSILASDWLPYAMLAAFVLATVLAAGAAQVPPRPALIGAALLLGASAWTALSAAWSPLPALARDEALLVLFYTLALMIPLLTLRTEEARLAAVVVVVAATAGVAVATALRLSAGADPDEAYFFGRLAAPIGYVNAQAASFLLAFWPAVALAARRGSPIVGRALALGAAVAVLAGGLLVQSKGGAVALGVSALVFFAVAPRRVRVAVPTLIAVGLVAAAYHPLTEPFRSQDEGLADAAAGAGETALLLTGIGLLLGAAYAAADRWLEIPLSVQRLSGPAALAAIGLLALVVAVAFFARVERPSAYIGDRWADFKSEPGVETGSSHLVNLGSNRYDFWRVALSEFRDHPLAGIGGRGWEVAYLEQGRSDETPRRAHSLEFDVLSEVGLVGAALLAGALLLALAGVLRRGVGDLTSAGVLAAATYWLVHASGDWIWTFPAVGVPFFLLLGTGQATDGPRLPRSWALGGAAASVAAALLLFAPPWLSTRFTDQALGQSPADARAEFRWARRLDPLATDPLIAEAVVAVTPAGAISALERARDREPRSAEIHYLLGQELLRAERRPEALASFRRARELAPRDPRIAAALARAAGRGGP